MKSAIHDFWPLLSPCSKSLKPDNCQQLPWLVRSRSWTRRHCSSSSWCCGEIESQNNWCYLRQAISPVEIEKDIVKLLEEKEARRHTLPAGNRVALTGAPTNLHIFDHNTTKNITNKYNWKTETYIWFRMELNLISHTSWKYCWAIFKCSRDPFSLKMKLFVI